MIAINSNCSRVDAVKASANQLKIQFAQTQRTGEPNDKQRKLDGELQSLDAEIKTGDAKKAEQALAAVRSAADNLQSASENASPSKSPNRDERSLRLDVYA